MLKVLLKVKVVQGDKSIMEGKRKLISLTVNSACIVWFLWSNLITITNAEKEPVDDSIVTLPPVSLLFFKKIQMLISIVYRKQRWSMELLERMNKLRIWALYMHSQQLFPLFLSRKLETKLFS